MIESCTKKRMLIGISLLGGLTILVLIAESHWTDTANKLYQDNFENTTTCISGEEYLITSECHPCSAFEIASKSIGVCVHARYKEVLKCKSGETITRSCDKVAWLEETTFWKFEGCMLALAVISCISVIWRENVLRHRIIRKVAKQLKAAQSKMDEVYLEVYSFEYPLPDLCNVPIETVITLFTIRYCDSKISIKLVPSKEKPCERAYSITISDFTYEVVDTKEIPYSASSCELPIITVNKISCIAGLCAILREIVKDTTSADANHYCRKLLGFKDSCLTACSEASIWTKFCEVDLITTLKFLHAEGTVESELPTSMARFECHMSQPVRLHNLYKYTMSKKFAKDCAISPDKQPRLPEHVYAEGSYSTLADIIIFVCVHIVFHVYSGRTARTLLPLTTNWYERMLDDKIILQCLDCLTPFTRKSKNAPDYTLPQVANQSLYKSDPKRYKPRSRIYTRQEDIVESLSVVQTLGIEIMLDPKPFGVDVDLDWSTVPYDATPEGGALPPTRLKKKQEQLENMCKPVMRLAKAGNVIVDFCSGSGHLGILVAHLLPHCSVILLENKEESLNRAKDRVHKLQLNNVKFFQCNLDYFKGDFDIGMSLHACGVATDLVIQQCVRKKATFVCCPCCYGSLQVCHHLTYPRSSIFRRRVEQGKYTVLSHAADQTHDEQNAKTKQGYDCMAIIDTDRKLQAEEFDYTVHLAKFVPDTCTPKNHILVGIPKTEDINDVREYSNGYL